jgi:hypothetical protein
MGSPTMGIPTGAHDPSALSGHLPDCAGEGIRGWPWEIFLQVCTAGALQAGPMLALLRLSDKSPRVLVYG